jgi:hypothetical protein
MGIQSAASGNRTSCWSTGSLPSMSILGIGRDIFIDDNSKNGPSLGGGIKGYMPQSLPRHDNSNDFAQTRFTLRDSWNTTKYSGQDGSRKTRIVTPFRAVMNAGDVLSRQDYSCGGSCQTPQSIPGVHGIKHHLGSVRGSCVPSVVYSALQMNVLIPAAACNGKFVYDGSDYTTFLKQRAINKNYNDRSFGGNNSSGSQSALRAIRH